MTLTMRPLESIIRQEINLRFFIMSCRKWRGNFLAYQNWIFMSHVSINQWLSIHIAFFRTLSKVYEFRDSSFLFPIQCQLLIWRCVSLISFPPETRPTPFLRFSSVPPVFQFLVVPSLACDCKY